MPDTPEKKAPTPAKSEPAPPAAEPAPGPRRAGAPLPLIGVVLGAAVAGVLLGSLALGPQLVRARASAKPAAHGTGEASAAGSKGGHGPGSNQKHAVIRFENLIVNPTGSEGTHFLMVTVAIEFADEKTAMNIQEREDEVRDRVMALLQKRTIESLAAPGARESIKREIAGALLAVAGDARAVAVYLPQFVIQ